MYVVGGGSVRFLGKKKSVFQVPRNFLGPEVIWDMGGLFGRKAVCCCDSVACSVLPTGRNKKNASLGFSIYMCVFERFPEEFGVFFLFLCVFPTCVFLPAMFPKKHRVSRFMSETEWLFGA